MKLGKKCGRLSNSSGFQQNILVMLRNERNDTPRVIEDTSCTEIRETLVYYDYSWPTNLIAM